MPVIAKGGDAESFDDFVRRYASYVRSVIRGEMGADLRKRVESEDLVQETFLQAYRSLSQRREKGEDVLRHWLGVIARHVVQSRGRHERAQKVDLKREKSLSQSVERSAGKGGGIGSRLRDPGPTPSEAYRRGERFERLQKALDSLSPDHRKVICLVRLDGLPVKEAARLMGRTPGATSVLLLRALLKLKAAFGNTDSFHLPPQLLDGREENHGREKSGT